MIRYKIFIMLMLLLSSMLPAQQSSNELGVKYGAFSFIKKSNITREIRITFSEVLSGIRLTTNGKNNKTAIFCKGKIIFFPKFTLYCKD